MQAVIRASAGNQINQSAVAFDKLAIPHVQLSGNSRRGHSPIGKANAQVADGIALGASQIKIRRCIGGGLRIAVAEIDHFAHRIVVNRSQNRRIIRLAFTDQPAHDHQAGIG